MSPSALLTHSTTLQHTTSHCNTMLHTATHCNTLQHAVTHYDRLHHATTRCNRQRQSATGYKTQKTAMSCLDDTQKTAMDEKSTSHVTMHPFDTL